MSILSTNETSTASVTSDHLSVPSTPISLDAPTASSSVGFSHRAGQRRLRKETVSNPMIKAIPDELIDVLKKYRSGLAGAIEANDYSAIRIMVENDVVSDINIRAGIVGRQYPNFYIDNGRTALEKAVEVGDVDLIHLLLAKGADPLSLYSSAQSQENKPLLYTKTTAVYDAVKSNRLDILDVFIKKGININYCCYESSRGFPGGLILGEIKNPKIKAFATLPIGIALAGIDNKHKAITNMIVNKMRFFLDRGANPNSPVTWGGSLLTYTLIAPNSAEKDELIKLLIERGAKV